MEIRDLEKTTISLVPELVFMESDTVLVQYIISSWSLQHRNASELWSAWWPVTINMATQVTRTKVST